MHEAKMRTVPRTVRVLNLAEGFLLSVSIIRVFIELLDGREMAERW